MGIKNVLTGERKIDLGGATYRMLPDFECLVELEEELGSLSSFIQKAAVGNGANVKIKEVALIVYYGIRAGEGEEKCPDYSQIGRMILEKGLVTVMIECIHFLSGALLDEEQQKKVDTIVKKAETTGGSRKRKNKG